MNTEYIEHKILSYNEKLLHKNFSNTSIGLFHGKMGYCIYFYLQYRKYGNIRYMTLADSLLQDVYSNLQDSTVPNNNSGICTNIQDGLTGIAFGLMFLMENGLCEGNPNRILKDIDYILYKSLYNSCNITSSSLIEDLYKCLYFCKRLQNTKLSINDREIFTHLIIHAFNKLNNKMPEMINSEPAIFSPFGYSLLLFLLLMSDIIKLDIHPAKTKRIIKEWGEKIYNIIPLSIGHRYLFNGILTHINRVLKYKEITYYKDNFLTHTEISEFFNSEMRNMSLSISFGVSGLWLFTKLSELYHAPIQELVNKKIVSSEIWKIKDNDEDFLNNDSLFDGLTGVILTYQQTCTYE